MRSSCKATLFAAVSVAVLLATAGVRASASTTDSDDFYLVCNPTCAASTGGTHVTAKNVTNTVFTVPPTGGITVTCTRSTAGGTPPAKSAGLAAFPVKPLPTFNDGKTSTGTVKPCTDNLGGTETSTTNNTNGKWKIGTVDASNDETSAEPTTCTSTTCDHLKIVIPKAGAIVTTSQGCTITVAPSAAFTVTGTYTDGAGGVYHLTINVSNLPISVSGVTTCPSLGATTASFTGTYTFGPGVRDGS
jgi:hypothetical protein